VPRVHEGQECMSPGRIPILEVDLDLAAALERERLRQAQERVTGELLTVDARRRWTPPDSLAAADQFGLLVVRGVLL
jgi:hypothetical protein